MGDSLNSLKGATVYRRLYRAAFIGIIKGDARSLDYSSYESSQRPVIKECHCGILLYNMLGVFNFGRVEGVFLGRGD